MEISLTHLLRASKYGLDLQAYIALLSRYENFSVLRYISAETLENLREEKLFTKTNRLTVLGQAIIEDIIGISSEERELQFKEFWETFPKSDELAPFHPPTRSMKVKEKDCQREYYKLLRTVSHETIMSGLKKQLQHARLNSKSGDNRLTFIKNSDNWLKNRDFEIWVDSTQSSQNNEPLPNVN